MNENENEIVRSQLVFLKIFLKICIFILTMPIGVVL